MILAELLDEFFPFHLRSRQVSCVIDDEMTMEHYDHRSLLEGNGAICGTPCMSRWQAPCGFISRAGA